MLPCQAKESSRVGIASRRQGIRGLFRRPCSDLKTVSRATHFQFEEHKCDTRSLLPTMTLQLLPGATENGPMVVWASLCIESMLKEKRLSCLATLVFKGDEIKKGQKTDEFPVQKFYWKDPYARLVGEQTKSFTFRYKIVPVEGKPGNLTPMTSLPILTTNEVELTAKCSPSLSATFNRGLISTHYTARAKYLPSATQHNRGITSQQNRRHIPLRSRSNCRLPPPVRRDRRSSACRAGRR